MAKKTFDEYVAGQQEQPVSTEPRKISFEDYSAQNEQAQRDAELEQIKGDVARETLSVLTGNRFSPGMIDKASRFISGSVDLLKTGIVDFPRQIAYWGASKFYEDDELDEPAERKELMNKVADVMNYVIPISKPLEALEGATEEYVEPLINTHAGKDYEQLFAEGNISEGVDALAGDVASALPSVAAAFTGYGGLALLGASSAGGKFEERFKDGEHEESENQLLGNALWSGAGELASEFVTNRLFFGLGKVAGLGKKPIQNAIASFFKSAGLEGASEVGAGLNSRLADAVISGDEDAFEGAWKEARKNFTIGAILGGGISAVADNHGEGPADAVTRAITPQEIKDTLNESASKINKHYSDYYDAEAAEADGLVIDTFEEAARGEERRIEKARKAIREQAEGLSESQLEELYDLNEQYHTLDSYINESDGYAANVDIQNRLEAIKERQNAIFANPEGKDILKKEPVSKRAKKLSKEAQQAYDAGERGWALTSKLEGLARVTANNHWYKIPKEKRVGTKEDFVRGLTHGKGGIRDLIKTYNPEKNVPIAAYTADILKKRANRIVQDYTKKEFEQDITALAGGGPATTSPAETAVKLEVDPGVLDRAENAIGKFVETLPDVKSLKDFEKKQKETVRKDVIPALKKKLKPKGDQATKRKALRQFVHKNAPELLKLVKQSPGLVKVRKGPLASIHQWNNKDFADYVLGNDLDLSTKEGKAALNSRKDKLIERVADGLGEAAWNDAIDRDTNAKKAVQEFNIRINDQLKAQFKPGLKYDNVDVTAFQEAMQDGDAEAQGKDINWIWKEVLGKDTKLKRTSQETRDQYHKEALEAAASGLIAPWMIKATYPAGFGSKAGIPRRGGMYNSVSDPKLLQLLEVAEANWKGEIRAPKRVKINDKSLTPESIEANKSQQAENHAALDAFGQAIQGLVNEHPTFAAILVHDAYRSSDGLIKIAAPLKYASKNFEYGWSGKQNTGHKYREEHAVPASIIGAYMLSNAKAGTWAKIFPHIKRNFVQMMLSKKDDQKFDDAKLADVMPVGWKMTDNVLARYFNKHLIETTGGIDPAGLYDINTGLSVYEQYVEGKTAPKRLEAFDFDDTLYGSDSKVIVKRGKERLELTPEEYATYKPEKGDIQDFSQFDDVINPKTLPGIKALDRALKEGNDVVIVTARKQIAEGPVMKLLQKRYGPLANNIRFKGVASSLPQAKANYLENKIKKGGYESAFFMDDAQANVDAINKLFKKLDIQGKSIQASYKHGKPGLLFGKRNASNPKQENMAKKNRRKFREWISKNKLEDNANNWLEFQKREIDGLIKSGNTNQFIYVTGKTKAKRAARIKRIEDLKQYIKEKGGKITLDYTEIETDGTRGGAFTVNLQKKSIDDVLREKWSNFDSLAEWQKEDLRETEKIKRGLEADHRVNDKISEKADLVMKHFIAQQAIQPRNVATDVTALLQRAWGSVGIQTTTSPSLAAQKLLDDGHFENINDATEYINSVNGLKVGSFVYVNPATQAETSIHEFSHLWNTVMQARAPRIFNNLFFKIQQEAPDLIYEQEKRLAQSGYQLEEGSAEWKDEVMAGILGNHGNYKVAKKAAERGGWKDLFDKWWETIGNFLGINARGKSIEDLNVEQTLDLIADEIFTGSPMSKLQQLDKKGWISLAGKRNAAGKNMLRAQKDPRIAAVKKFKESFEESGDLDKAFKDAYEGVKKDFPNYQDFADIIKEVAKVKLSPLNPTVTLAKASVIRERIKSKRAEINARKHRADEGFKSKFRKIIHEGSDRKPSSFFISPNAEDFTGLLDALLPKGRSKAKQGVENQQWLEQNLVRPYTDGINAAETEVYNKLEIFKGISKGLKLNESLFRGYTLGDAILYQAAKKQGKETNIKDKRIIEALEAAVTGNDASKLVDFLVNDVGFEFNNDQVGRPLARTIFTEVNRLARTHHMKTFKNNVDALFKDGEIWEFIKETKGEAYMHALKNTLTRMKTGRNRAAHDAEANKFTKWLGRAVGTTMFWNVRSAGLQLISTVNYAMKPGMSYGKIASAWSVNRAETKQAAKELMETGYMRNRVSGAKFDLLADEAAVSENIIDKIQAWGFKPTKWGDRKAILWGGTPYYLERQKQLRKENPSWTEEQIKDQAKSDFIRITEESQQSSDPARISEIQASSVGKIIYAFANTPFQYARIAKKRINDLASGRSAKKGTIKSDLRELAWYSATNAAVFTTLQSGLAALAFADTDDEKLEEKGIQAIESALTSLVKTFGNHGAVMSALWGVLDSAYGILPTTREKRGGDAAIEALGISPPLQTKFKDLRNALDASKKAYKDEDWKQALYATGEGVAFSTGVALDRVIKKVDNLATWFNDEAELWQKLMRTAGYSDWDVGGGNLILPEWGSKPKKGEPGYVPPGVQRAKDRQKELRKKFKKKSPLDKGEMGQAFRDGTIEVDPNLSPIEREKTIAHEMKHVEQMKNEGLDYDDNNVYFRGHAHKRKNGKIEYDGKWYKEGHPSLPWEAAAFRAE